jgi:hypothetical protein
VVKWDINYPLHLASTPFTAVLNILPILTPFFAPLKWQLAGNTDFRSEAIFNLGYSLRVFHT